MLGHFFKSFSEIKGKTITKTDGKNDGVSINNIIIWDLDENQEFLLRTLFNFQHEFL